MNHHNEEAQNRDQYSINLEIDKMIYKNRDQVKGYV